MYMPNFNRLIASVFLSCAVIAPISADTGKISPIKGVWKSSYGLFIITDQFSAITYDDGKSVAYMCFFQSVEVKDYYQIQCYVPDEKKLKAAQLELSKSGIEYDVTRKPFGGKIEIGHVDFVIYLRDKPEVAYER